MKTNDLKYSELTIDRLKEALDMITRVYHEHNGKDDTDEGHEKFKELIDYDWHRNALENRFEFDPEPEIKFEEEEGRFMLCIGSFCIQPEFRMWICEDSVSNKIVGVLATYDEHVYWMFVDGNYQRRGIARKLFDIMIEEKKPERLTVSASLYAVDVYRKLGFNATGTEKIACGIRYIPMEYVNECA